MIWNALLSISEVEINRFNGGPISSENDLRGISLTMAMMAAITLADPLSLA